MGHANVWNSHPKNYGPAVCVEIPMVLSGSTGLCAADSASVAMPRKSDSSRDNNTSIMVAASVPHKPTRKNRKGCGLELCKRTKLLSVIKTVYTDDQCLPSGSLVSYAFAFMFPCESDPWVDDSMIIQFSLLPLSFWSYQTAKSTIKFVHGISGISIWSFVRQGEDGCVWILGFDPSCWDCLYVFQSFLFSWATDNDVEDRSRCSPFSLDGSYRQGISREEIQTDRQRRFED
uniref:Uncharacterized protein n=1 Tax=Salix viminalis TaxID=40686 RepID=A0A6N2KCQ6_SALVM